MTAPRIDTVRNRLTTTITRLHRARLTLTDMHTLAYDRPAALLQARVSGGDPTAVGIDIDTHGDPKARAAYEQLANKLLAIAALVDTIDDPELVELFARGEIRTRRDTTADATSREILEQFARRHQRVHIESQSADPISPQPMPRGANKLLDATRLQAELEALQGAVRKSGHRPDRARLTPLELAAWNTAMGTTTKRKKTR